MLRVVSLFLLISTLLSPVASQAMTDDEMSKLARSNNCYRNVGAICNVTPENKEFFGVLLYILKKNMS